MGALTVEIRVSKWRAMWALRAAMLAMHISPDNPRIKNALRRAAVSLMNWGLRFWINGKRVQNPGLLTEEMIFD